MSIRGTWLLVTASALLCGCDQGGAAEPGGGGDDGSAGGLWGFFDEPQSGRVCIAKDGGFFCAPEEPQVPDGGGDVCYYPSDSSVSEEPAADAWFTIESIGEEQVHHVRIAFAEWFVDNTYGVNSSDGWGKNGDKQHTFRDLLGSDHVELAFLDASGASVLAAKFDYISESADIASGYRNLGVLGGDGALLSGDAADVIATSTSLDHDINGLGCVYDVDSPAPGKCPGWENQVVYEAWVRDSAFAAGWGGVQFESVHASPSRTSSNTVEVEEGECPTGSGAGDGGGDEVF